METSPISQLRAQVVNERQTRIQIEETLRQLRKENAQLRKDVGVDDYYIIHIPKHHTITSRIQNYVRSFQSAKDVQQRTLTVVKTCLQWTSHFLNEFIELLWPVDGPAEDEKAD